MKHLRKLLFPFATIYYVVVWIRNYLFDSGVWKSKEYDFPLICVGNLSVGGTGKTPMTEFLIRLLKEKYSLGILSRGYGRSTSGYKLVDRVHKAKEVGDEPLQYRSKFDNITVAVCEDRREGIQQLRSEMSMPDVILLDDAFQHRKVKAGYNILLSSFDDLFTIDYVLPAGDLRESRSGAKRAQSLVITKCPLDLERNKMNAIKLKIQKYYTGPIYFSTITYNKIVYSQDHSMQLEELLGKKITLVTGIANPSPLLDFLTEAGLNYEHKAFKDHHNFTSREIVSLEKNSFILTTEKDYMRLKSKLSQTDLYYLPIGIDFLNEEREVFKNDILDFCISK